MPQRPRKPPKNRCFIPSCEASCEQGRRLCEPHLAQLPAKVRDDVNRHARGGRWTACAARAVRRAVTWHRDKGAHWGQKLELKVKAGDSSRQAIVQPKPGDYGT